MTQAKSQSLFSAWISLVNSGVRNRTIQGALEENNNKLHNNKNPMKMTTDKTREITDAHLTNTGSLKPANIFSSIASTINSETHC